MKVATDLHLTKHARQRLQQRGIKASTLSLLHEYGRRVYTHTGAVKLIWDHASRRQIQAAMGRAAAQFKWTAYVVVDAVRCDTAISVGHRTVRVRR